ncbi:Protein phosphatase 1 regulatory subunit 1B [Cricetulus griseus]|uniref:Protein phosphatase 1 regulatory subunit 1B n=1 Tax=Cricetulus griseus TaxID=10029 RepID=G3H5X5_CRIGR|nr:Protein phosphatase 1 regulatory subunit 1B [Cricetulus griseus]
MDPKDRKKIQFSVPAPPSQLDPRQVEMIRRRRPTPAMLFRLSEHSSPAVQRIAESHLQTISNLGENQASEEEDELGELRELGYPREDDEEEEDEDEEEDEEEDSQAEVLKGSRGTVGQKLTYGQGLEGPWERPPPLDEPQRDGNSEDQVEDRAVLSGLWSKNDDTLEFFGVPECSFSQTGTRLPPLVCEALGREGRDWGGAAGAHHSRVAFGGRAQRRKLRRWEVSFRSEELPGPWSGTAAEAGRVGAVVT